MVGKWQVAIFVADAAALLLDNSSVVEVLLLPPESGSGGTNSGRKTHRKSAKTPHNEIESLTTFKQTFDFYVIAAIKVAVILDNENMRIEM